MGVTCSDGCVIPLEKPVKTCRKWKLQVSLGYYDPVRKCYPKKSRRFKGTKTEAKKALRKFIAEIESGTTPLDSDILFPRFAEMWLSERNGAISKGTMRKNREQVKGLGVYLANYRVRDIDLSVVRSVFSKLRTEGGLSGRPLSGTTCQGMFATLSLVLDYAKYKKLLVENPCKLIDRKTRPKPDTREKEALSIDQLQSLNEVLYEGEPTGKKIGIILAVSCGLCREELLAVQRHDVDIVQKCIRVNSANTSDDEGLTVTKNEHRNRIVPIGGRELARIAEWFDVQERKLTAKGITVTGHTPVVSNPVGEFMHPEAYAKWWRRFRDKIGLQGVGLHQLRHTYATILCASGVDIITAFKLMGHKDATMLARVYAHVVPENARNAADIVSEVLSGSRDLLYMPFA